MSGYNLLCFPLASVIIPLGGQELGDIWPHPHYARYGHDADATRSESCTTNAQGVGFQLHPIVHGDAFVPFFCQQVVKVVAHYVVGLILVSCCPRGLPMHLHCLHNSVSASC